MIMPSAPYIYSQAELLARARLLLFKVLGPDAEG